MPEPDSWKRRLQPKVADQVDYIVTQFHRAGIEVGLVTANGGIGFMYAEDQVLVRSEYLQQVLPVLERHFDIGRREHVVSDVELVHLRPKASGERLPELPEVFIPKPLRERQLTVIGVLELIAMEVGEEAAAPNHVLTVAGPPG